MPQTIPYASLGSNTGYIATASEGLVIAYSRDPASFRLAQYCGNKPVRRRRGYYQRFNPAVQGRLGNNPANDARWAPGADRPNGLKNQEEFEFAGYLTERYDEPVNAERTAMEQADWAVEDHNAVTIGNLAMRRRTWLAERALSTMLPKAPVDSGDVNSIYPKIFGSGATGNLASATSDKPAILGVLNYGAVAINKATHSTVGPRDLTVKINPTTASILALQPEIQNAFIQSPYAKGLISGNDESPDAAIAAYNANWGLPVFLRGYRIVIEDATWDLSLPGEDGNPQYIMPDNCMDLLATPGGMDRRYMKEDIQEGPEERYYPVNWTLTEFMYQDLQAESFDEVKHRRTDSHVSYDLQPQVVAPQTGFRFTKLFSNN